MNSKCQYEIVMSCHTKFFIDIMPHHTMSNSFESLKINKQQDVQVTLKCEVHIRTLLMNIPVSGSMPYSNSTIFRTCYYYGKFRMKAYSRDIVCVAFQCLDTTFGLIVPHLHL